MGLAPRKTGIGDQNEKPETFKSELHIFTPILGGLAGYLVLVFGWWGLRNAVHW